MTKTVEQQIDVLKLYIATKPVTDGWLLKEDHHVRDMMQSQAPKCSSAIRWRRDQVSRLVADLRFSVEHHLVHPDHTTTERLTFLQERNAEVREAQLSKPSAQDTLRVGAEALQKVALVSNPTPVPAQSQRGAA